MPLILNKTYRTGSHLLIWELAEELNWLEDKVSLNNEEQAYYDAITFERRKKEWLTIRYLVKRFVGAAVGITYDEEGKPFLNNSSFHVSISHSHALVGIQLHPDKSVGLDIELISDRVEKIAKRFLSIAELEAVGVLNRIEKLVVHWGAKEAIIKVIGKRTIDFKKEILIAPFIYQKEATINAEIKCSTVQRDFHLNYFCLNDYMVVFTEW